MDEGKSFHDVSGLFTDLLNANYAAAQQRLDRISEERFITLIPDYEPNLFAGVFVPISGTPALHDRAVERATRSWEQFDRAFDRIEQSHLSADAVNAIRTGAIDRVAAFLREIGLASIASDHFFIVRNEGTKQVLAIVADAREFEKLGDPFDPSLQSLAEANFREHLRRGPCLHE